MIIKQKMLENGGRPQGKVTVARREYDDVSEAIRSCERDDPKKNRLSLQAGCGLRHGMSDAVELNSVSFRDPDVVETTDEQSSACRGTGVLHHPARLNRDDKEGCIRRGGLTELIDEWWSISDRFKINWRG